MLSLGLRIRAFVIYNPTREIEEKTEGIDVTDPTSKKGLVLCARSGFVTINPYVKSTIA